MSPDNVEIVRLIFDGTQAGIARGDLGAAFDLGVEAGVMAPDAELVPARELATGQSSFRGREGFVEFMRIWTEDFEDWSAEAERLKEAPGGRVVAVLRQRGTGRGSGAPVELTHSILFELDEGRITRINVFLKSHEAFEAAGVHE